MLTNLLRRTAHAVVPAALRDPGGWHLVDDTDPPGLPAGWRGVSGPWRHQGQPMHGLYCRAAEDVELNDQFDGMAVLNGWRAGYWRGPAALAGWSAPLVSAWNPLLAQGDGRLSVHISLDHDEWTADAVLGGWKPYGYLSCSRRTAREVRARAADAPFGVAVSRRTHRGISLARTATLGELFRGTLLDLLHAYASALPMETYQRDVAPLTGQMSVSPADFLDDFAALEGGPLARLGLVLGYPPLVTAGWLQRPAGMWVERGSLPAADLIPPSCPRAGIGGSR